MHGWKIVSNPPFASGVFSEQHTAAWHTLKQQLPLGILLTGKVYIQAQFGVFYDAGLGFPVLLEVVQFGKERARYPEDYPELTSEVTGRLAGFDESNHQLRVVNSALAWPIEQDKPSK